MAENKSLVAYQADQGEVKLSPDIVKRYLVSGDADKVTDQEVMMFIQMCRYQGLNPFLREAYLIKFGNSPATMVTGKDTFTKRAAKSEKCAGYEAGVVVRKKDGSIEQRNGALVLPDEELVGGWARIHRKDWKVPLEITVSLKEYQRYNNKGELMRNWKEMPATMIRKVALVQGLREAIPEEFSGLYSPEEMPIDDSKLDETVVEVPYEVQEEIPKQEKAEEEKASERQIKLIHQLKNELGIDEEGYRKALKAYYNKNSSKELTKEEASDLIKRLMDKREKLEKQKGQETAVEQVEAEQTEAEQIRLPWEEDEQ